ncbi:MAG TPA: hypothetical protein VI775_02355, partial [Candidatus Paceibacterota bacterium]
MSEKVKCLECEESILKDDATYVESESGYVCSDCLGDKYFLCFECDKYHHSDDGWYVDSEEAYVCDVCFDRYYGRCANCRYSMRSSEMYSSDGEYYCPDCYNDEYDYDDEEIVDEYHCGGGRGDYSKNYRYRVGVELEREDRDTKESIDTYKLRNDYGWVVESDSSLDS